MSAKDGPDAMADLTYQDILDILRLVDAAPFSDVEVEFAGTRVKVTRRGTGPAAAPTTAPAPVPAVVASPAPASAPTASSTPAKTVTTSPAADAVAVKPPMAGTFYAAPSPGAPPFVTVDRAVHKGDQLGIVEVMKLFTPVPAPCDGTVRAILVANEEFVESDRTLMLIEPAK